MAQNSGVLDVETLQKKPKVLKAAKLGKIGKVSGKVVKKLEKPQPNQQNQLTVDQQEKQPISDRRVEFYRDSLVHAAVGELRGMIQRYGSNYEQLLIDTPLIAGSMVSVLVLAGRSAANQIENHETVLGTIEQHRQEKLQLVSRSIPAIVEPIGVSKDKPETLLQASTTNAQTSSSAQLIVTSHANSPIISTNMSQLDPILERIVSSVDVIGKTVDGSVISSLTKSSGTEEGSAGEKSGDASHSARGSHGADDSHSADSANVVIEKCEVLPNFFERKLRKKRLPKK